MVEHPARLSISAGKEDVLAGMAEEAEVEALWRDIHLEVGHGPGENGEEQQTEEVEKTACQRVGETSRDTAVQYKAVTSGYLRIHEEWQRRPIMISTQPIHSLLSITG